MKSEFSNLHVFVITFILLSSCSPAETSIVPIIPSNEFTITPIIENTAQPLTDATDFVITAPAKNIPTIVLLSTLTPITVSRPTREKVEKADIPLLPVGNKGADVYYISAPKDSIYLWLAVCAGKNIQDLQQNANDMQVAFLINDQVVNKSQILEFDRVIEGNPAEPNAVERTWAVLISGWPTHATTKIELRYYLSQVFSIDGLYNTKGNFYSTVYVNSK